MYSEAFRAPSINENNIKIPGVIYGDSKLNSELVQTLDFGLTYDNDQIHTGISYFNSKQSGIIKFAGYPLIYGNRKTITLSGFEFEGKYYLNRNVYFEGSALYMTNKSDTTDNLTPIGNLNTKLGVSYLCERGITIGLFDIFQGAPDKHYAGNMSVNKFSYNLLQFHSKLNINKIFRLKFKPDLSLIADVDNILDQKYYFFDQGSTLYPTPRFEGRSFYLSLGVTF